MDNLPENSILFADGSKGIHIPWNMASLNSNDRLQWHNFKPTDIDILLDGPDHPDYWEVWEDVLNEVTVTLENPNDVFNTYSLYQDGDLWLVPVTE
ncbi:unnamed protein product [marine sediment metagenome]|uniref:Uncharacterized protein n=1 Tax=marine sediment metagenome TaxID=412755 RepID=X0T6C4_9ZZZZ